MDYTDSIMNKLLFAFVLTILALPAWGADKALGGKILFTSGTVTADGKEVEEGDVLSPVVTLKTGPKSRAEVAFDGKNIFRLGENTVVKVDFSELRKVVVLQNGNFTSVLRNLAKGVGSDAFQLKTPSVAAGVRGTSFCVWVKDDLTYFCTCNGSVALQDSSGGNPFLTNNAHHGAKVYTKTATGYTVQDAGLEHHTDADLESLAKEIGETIDWTKVDKHSAAQGQ